MSTTHAAPHSATTPVRDLATWNLATVGAEATLREVAEELALDEIGVVVVAHGSDPVGLVSERDLVAVIAGGWSADTQAADMMTVDLVTTSGTTTVADVARLMIESGVRHVLVREDAAEGGRLSGMVSIRDVVEPLLADRT
ncbi:CBS domain-containing protein [Actinomycetospora chibensis]|uniref:CBS domain-containing protein n=1 Tax=Actinomycetospora chibensis TaxID=663606 RepID=A0ABV9RAW6_9PSEU|nr:CBS domain-containing protein [Actinomycetospora chibensis]MDD7922194.1 CBS domain-containing protein [Actinomycetospora chibensis]